MIILSILFLVTVKAFNLNFINKERSTINDLWWNYLVNKDSSIHVFNKKIKQQKINSLLFTRIVALVLFYAGLITINSLYIQSIGSGIGIFSGLFFVSQITLIIEGFIFFIGSFILCSFPINWIPRFLFNNKLSSSINDSHLSSSNKESNQELEINYSIVVLFSSLGSSLLLSSSDLISLYLSVELQSFGLYVLATLYKNSESSTSAGLKYFLLGGLASCIILFGAGLIYSYSGLTNLELIYSLVSVLIHGMITNLESSINVLSDSLPHLLSTNNMSSPIIGEFSNTFNINNTLIDSLNNIANLNIVSSTSYNTEISYLFEGAGTDKTNILFLQTTAPILIGIYLGFIIIFVGFLFKMSAAPLHNWSPDVYNDTPTVVTSWLVIIPKLSIIILLLELYFQIDNSNLFLSGQLLNLYYSSIIGEFNSTLNQIFNLAPFNGIDLTVVISSIKNLLLISSLLSLIIGSLVGLAQNQIKRLLAYSTISHIGFILLSLGIKSEQSIDSLLFYIIQYTITNLNIFLILISFSYLMNKKKDIKWISELKGQFFENPAITLSLVISFFSLAGVPPLIGFFAKQYTLYAAIQSGYYFISLIAIITSVISASYYLKVIRVVMLEYESLENLLVRIKKSWLKKPLPKKIKSTEFIADNTGIIISDVHCYLISTLTFSILLFILKPSIILSSTSVLSFHMFFN